jgi:SAM-dependent methyltransferase
MIQSLPMKTLRQIRARLVPKLKPKEKYFLVPTRSLEPISKNHGYDRGTPIDRYYIEKFLEQNKNLIKGRCLEVTDNYYTMKYGRGKVTKSDALDIKKSNRRANIHDDLRKLNKVKSNTYDTVILTHVLGLIDDIDAAIKEVYRILKPSGSALVVVGSSGSYNPRTDFWKFTQNSLRLLFAKCFKNENMEVTSFGNVLSSQYHLVGLAAEEMSPEEIDYHHPRYTIIIGMVAKK